jgi:ribonuclease HII
MFSINIILVTILNISLKKYTIRLDFLKCGVDEAGRGPLAGPVVVAAVIFDNRNRVSGVKDSKKLTSNQRIDFYHKILEKCTAFSVSVINNNIIDKINILKATMLGMEKCLDLVIRTKIKILIDGNYFRLNQNRQINFDFETIVKGDEKIFEISCASIIAKVTRDKLMLEFDKKYPGYKFKSNKGYPTREHINAIKLLGTTEIHRMTFCEKFMQN